MKALERQTGSARRLASRAGALVLSVILAAGLMEAALRVGFPVRKRHYVWPPGMKRVSRPSPLAMPGVEGAAHFNVNREGVRAPELGPDTEYRVLAMGGSTTECLYLDEGEAWPALVAGALPRTRDGRPVWMGNAGRAGTQSRDHVPQLKYLAAEMPRFDMVVMLVGVNDLTVALAMGDHYKMPAPVTDPEAEREQARRAFAITPGRLQDLTDDPDADRAPVYKRTALYQLVKRVRAGVAASSGALVQDELGKAFPVWRDRRRHASAMIDTPPGLDQPLAEYRRNLGFIADLAAQKGIRLVLLTQPSLWRRDLPAEARELLWLGGQGDFQASAGNAYYTVPVLADTMRRYNEALLQVCRERSLPCLDLAEQIPRETTMFYDDCHFTEAGSRAVAAAVSAHLGALPPF